MTLRKTYRNWIALSMQDKDIKKIFRQLPKEQKRAYYQLDKDKQKEFLLLLGVLKNNTKDKVIESIKQHANKTGLPAVEWLEYLTIEAKRETELAKRKLSSLTVGSTQNIGPITTEYPPGLNPKLLQDRLRIMRELEKNQPSKKPKR